MATIPITSLPEASNVKESDQLIVQDGSSTRRATVARVIEAAIDKTLTTEGKAADAKAVGDELAKKLDKNGGEMSGQITARNVPGFSDFAAVSDSIGIDAGFMAQNTQTNMAASFGIASNGALAGIYDHIGQQWMMCRPVNTKDVCLDGDRILPTCYINFLQKSVGLRWENSNGSKVDIRNQAHQDLFQMTLTPADGPEYGFLNVFDNKSMELAAYGELFIRDYVSGQRTDLFKGIIVSSGDGYIRFGNGIQICWGIDNLTQDIQPKAYASMTFTLPMAYSNTNYIPFAQQFIDAGGSTIVSITNTAHSTTYFTKTIVNGDSTSLIKANSVFEYFTIGKWK